MGIYNQVQQVEANKEQCTRLATRVRYVMDILKWLESTYQNMQYFENLKKLLKLLENIDTFIKK